MGRENEFEGVIDPRKEADAGTLQTFIGVQERMVEAMLLWWRAPDRERGWHTMRAYWPDIRRHTSLGDYSDTEAEPRPLPLTRAQVAEMERVGEWMAFIPEGDRRLVALALASLASGRKRVPWMKLRRIIGASCGADALRKRYASAIEQVCISLNRPKPAENRAGTCQ